jgi:hypothetical protein
MSSNGSQEWTSAVHWLTNQLLHFTQLNCTDSPTNYFTSLNWTALTHQPTTSLHSTELHWLTFTNCNISAWTTQKNTVAFVVAELLFVMLLIMLRSLSNSESTVLQYFEVSRVTSHCTSDGQLFVAALLFYSQTENKFDEH